MSTLVESPFWWTTAPAPPEASGPLPERVDVAIVGAGYTGLAAARGLARAGASVVVLESETIGWGASSRNGGQVLTGLKPANEGLVARLGQERARRLFAASLGAIDFVETLVAEEGIDCGFTRCGHLDAAYKPAHFEGFRREQERLARDFGHEVRLIARSEQRTELASDFYHGLLLDPKSASLHPARYVRGLAQAATRAGAALRERCAVLGLAPREGGFDLTTSRGSLRARDVVVATNGYTGAATPELRRRVVPVGSYIVATRPLDHEVARELLPQRRVVFDSKHFLYYFRLSADDRLLFGGRAQFTPATATSTRRAAEILSRGLVEVFPQLRGVAIDFVWSGNVCFTRDLLPRAGRLNGIHYALGYAGHGVAMASYLGDAVADVILGRPDRNPFRDLPFDPIPFYDGRPWFLPFVGAWYKLVDWAR